MTQFKSVSGLLALVLFSAVASLSAPAAERRIVVFKPRTSPAERLQLIKDNGGKVVRELPQINAVVIEDSSELRAQDARLLSLSQVARIDPDPVINWLLMADAPGLDFAPPSPAAILSGMKSLRSETLAWRRPRADSVTPWGIDRVKAPLAWKTTMGRGVKVAVIDTGIDFSHPDLAANVKGGWNAVKISTDYNDDNGHGTHCSGTIAGLNNTTGVIGVAPEAELYGVKVLDSRGSGTYDDVIAGMLWAVENKMEIASMSLGAGLGNQSLADAVEVMRKAGVILVAAAGNSGGPVSYPAAYPGAIAVSASDIDNRLASFSSRGRPVAVIAPGVDIRSTFLGGDYKTQSGTSMAAPHVAGILALYVSTHKGATPQQALVALAASSSRLPQVDRDSQGAGLPNANKIVH